MKTIFMSGGEREKALKYILDKGVNVVAVITPVLTKQNQRFEKVILTAVEYGIPVFPTGKDSLFNVLKNLEFELLVSCGYPYIISKKVLNISKYAINIHPTLLPKYRGFRSGAYVIINNEKQTGVTIHFLTDKIDQGDILMQKAFEISPFDTTRSLFRKCKAIEPQLLFDVILELEKGDFEVVPQDETKATILYHNRTPKDSFIDWNKPLKELYNEIRACDPNNYPAYFFVNGQKVCVKLWRPVKPEGEDDLI